MRLFSRPLPFVDETDGFRGPALMPMSRLFESQVATGEPCYP
jgi:hypothetical protein